jgi:hypothetical protein
MISMALTYGVGRHCHRPRHVVERDLPELHARQAERQSAAASPQARIRGQLLEKGIGIAKAVRNPRNLARGR